MARELRPACRQAGLLRFSLAGSLTRALVDSPAGEFGKDSEQRKAPPERGFSVVRFEIRQSPRSGR